MYKISCITLKYYCDRCNTFTAHNDDSKRKCLVCGHREDTAIKEMDKLLNSWDIV